MDMTTFGAAFKAARQQAKLSQRAVAEPLEMSDNANISRIESGKQGLVFEKLLKLDKILGIPLSELFKCAEEIEKGASPSFSSSIKINAILKEIGEMSTAVLTASEEDALVEGLKAQLSWLKANRQPKQNVDMATGDPDAAKLIDQYVKTAADNTPESMKLLGRQLDAQHEKQKSTGEVSNDKERQGDRSTGT